MNKNPLVSVIVPTKNSGEYLNDCLRSVVSQTYKNIEIIIVDNNSIDRTTQIASKFTNNVYSFGPERSAQTNFGIKKAKGKYIYRIDGDFYLNNKIIEEAVKKCEKEHIDGIAIHNTSDPTVSFWSKVRKFERDMYKNDDLVVGVRFYKNSAWKRLGGYDEKIVWDDYDFHN